MVCEIRRHRTKLLCATLQLSLLQTCQTSSQHKWFNQPQECDRSGVCIANSCSILPLEQTEAVTPGSSLCTSVIRSPTFISMGRRKNRHFSLLEGNGTSRTKRPYLYFKNTSATQRGEICGAFYAIYLVQR